jgi:predicted nucleic acid-binding protein
LPSFLVDTNVLLYAVDAADAPKRERAQACIARLGLAGTGALSAQVLSEFFAVATRKVLLSVPDAEEALQDLVRTWTVYDVTPTAVLEAVRGVRRHQLAYWDALIWATAKLQGVPNVLTEDPPGSMLLEGVKFLDPFAPTFDLALLD